MTNILAIDTSTEACSVALSLDGEVREEFALLERRHTARVLPMIESLLAEAGLGFAGLDALAFGRGPGSFTGLRIAAGVAQGLAFGAGLPVVPVSTLAALALQAHRQGKGRHILSCLDARIGEIYWGYFTAEADGVQLLLGEGLCFPADLNLPAGDSAQQWFGAGNGLKFRDSMSAGVQAAVGTFDIAMLPRAGDMAVLAGEIFRQGGGLAPELAAPVYLRDKVTHKKET